MSIHANLPFILRMSRFSGAYAKDFPKEFDQSMFAFSFFLGFLRTEMAKLNCAEVLSINHHASLFSERAGNWPKCRYVACNKIMHFLDK